MASREYNTWKREEEEALRLGVKKHGAGDWELIRTDPDFQKELYASPFSSFECLCGAFLSIVFFFVYRSACATMVALYMYITRTSKCALLLQLS